MALILLASASGSPGVTTCAVGLALAWPRPVVLLEADPTGGSSVLAGYFQGWTQPNDAMVELVMASRANRLGEALPQLLEPLPGSTAARLLSGPRSHAQARSLMDIWEPLAFELKALDRGGQDVIVDAGRLGLTSWPTSLPRMADLSLLLLRADLPSLAAARQWAETWRSYGQAADSGQGHGLVLVGPNRPYGPNEITKVLGLPVLEKLSWDPPAAAVFSRGDRPGRRHRRRPLARDLGRLAEAIGRRLAESKDILTPPDPEEAP
ncbi:MAG: hypothetical protein LBJ44_04025 [Propionibacteriaceae bacterium]|jgi:hypothetical protein|nr:hypothetical protein [Propionibacteriaceae bacterium]